MIKIKMKMVDGDSFTGELDVTVEEFKEILQLGWLHIVDKDIKQAIINTDNICTIAIEEEK